MQLKYSNYVAFSHDYGFAVNNSGLFEFSINILIISREYPVHEPCRTAPPPVLSAHQHSAP